LRCCHICTKQAFSSSIIRLANWPNGKALDYDFGCTTTPNSRIKRLQVRSLRWSDGFFFVLFFSLNNISGTQARSVPKEGKKKIPKLI
jgi:hypothetical protein